MLAPQLPDEITLVSRTSSSGQKGPSNQCVNRAKKFLAHRVSGGSSGDCRALGLISIPSSPTQLFRFKFGLASGPECGFVLSCLFG
jgi:hypothetical protein